MPEEGPFPLSASFFAGLPAHFCCFCFPTKTLHSLLLSHLVTQKKTERSPCSVFLYPNASHINYLYYTSIFWIWQSYFYLTYKRKMMPPASYSIPAHYASVARSLLATIFHRGNFPGGAAHPFALAPFGSLPLRKFRGAY